MKTRERVVIYTLLSLLLIVNAATIFNWTDMSATAGVQEESSVIARDPGPYSSLTTAALKFPGKEELAVRNTDGRLSWNDSPHARAYSKGYMHIGAAINQLMESEIFAQVRSDLDDEIREQEQEYRSQLQDYREQLEQLDRDSSNWQDIFNESNTLYREFVEWSREAAQRSDALQAEQLEQAYREMITAVEVVSDRREIDIVYRFIPTADEFKGDDREQALQAIRLRSVLRYPKGLDITPEVLDELGLEQEFE